MSWTKKRRDSGPLHYYRILTRNLRFAPSLAIYVVARDYSRSIVEWRGREARLNAYFDKNGRGPCAGDGA